MGRAEERRARQRGGRRAAPRGRRSSPAADRSLIRRLFTWKKILGTFFGVILLGMGAFIVLYMVIDIPEGNADAQRQGNVYKYSDGSIMTRKGYNREIVDLAKVPKDVQHTFVAAENKTFYKDSGVDLKGTARGVLNTLSGKGAQGGSTITQQYVKNYYLTQDQTVSRKLKELVISLKLDREKPKDYILAGYINTSFYGRSAYGIQAAAQAYYRVDAEDLTVEQGAYLAALLQAPNQYDWAIASETGKRLVEERWNYVLDNMVEQKWLDKSDREGMKFPVPKEPKPAPGMEGQTGYLVEAANTALKKQLVAGGTAEDMKQAEAMVEAGGWTVTLNIDKKKQAALEKAVKEQLTSKLDSKKRDVDADVQAGAASVDPKTGAVVAMYGGVDYVKHYRNNATRDDYQPASTFKPVILAAAVDEDAETQDGVPITANTLYDGTSERPVVDNGREVGFAPENEDDGNYGEIDVQEAMNKSVNSVFAQMGVDVGMSEVVDVAGKLGMETEGMDPVPAQTLGSMGASPLEMAGVYATLDNHGKKVTPAVVKSVEHNSRKVDFPDPIGDQVISREAADTVTSVLTGVVDDGTAKKSVRDNPMRDGQQVAGKTGTSDNNKSAWFTGYTPELVTAVGLFGEDSKTYGQVPMYKAGGEPRVNGGGFPAQIWAAYTFGVMDGVSKFDLETKQGAAVKPSSSATVTESPSQTPTEEETAEETPTEEPTSEEPTQEETTQAPEESPSMSPSGTPSTEPPTGGVTTGPEDPLFPGNDRREQ
ncbi:transglycosylase domain-containing protein [Streptomyces sp. NPDC087512]|uniref:transglycosylase domain-containing protein n=1 Tax=Streptomyces sp. NPDC087512 TaxID=3155059 RepID=UPI00342E72F8